MNLFSLYIHIPFCFLKCDYCDFFSVEKKIVSDDYILALLNEVQFYAKFFFVDEWKSVYIGGGTPSIMSEWQIEKLFLGIQKICPFSKNCEVTIEMNPSSISKEKIFVSQNCGATRLSLGIQSLCEDALKNLGRKCTAKVAQNALELVKKNWKGALNVDVIAGIPMQSDEHFFSSLSKIIDFYPDHISLYTLTVEEGTLLEKKILSGELIFFEDEADRQWILARDFLKKNGFLQYEVSNFSHKGFQSLHNLNYWRQNNYIGIGAAACGSVYGKKGFRWTNTRDIFKYVNFWNGEKKIDMEIPRKVEMLDLKTQEFEFLMMGLRTLEGVNSREYKNRFVEIPEWGGDLEKRLGKIFYDFQNQGLASSLQKKDGSKNFFLCENGILFLNKFLLSL